MPDNGSVFTSTEFSDFIKHNGIRHVELALYHAASNGWEERAVQTFKAFNVKKSTASTIHTHVSCFLSQYRITPHSTTGVTPAEMLFGHQPRTRLDLLRPDISNQVQSRQQSQKSHHGQRARERKFQTGDTVSVHNFTDNTWISGVIEKQNGPLSYYVKLQDGHMVCRHSDHILQLAHLETTLVADDNWMNLPGLSQDFATAQLQSSREQTNKSSCPPL